MDYKDPFDIADQCIAFGVRRVSRMVNNHYDHHLAPVGIRSTQFTILNALKALEDVTINELAEQLQTDRTTLTRNLKLLQDKGLVLKATGEDRRSRHISLSAAGKRKVDRATKAWAAAQEELLQRLGRSSYRRLMSELSIVEEAMQAVSEADS
jgi:DNA-binding MarR family transcriptional regulator